MIARIAATGSFVPPKVISNDQLTQFPPSALPLIEQKTGVKTRRHADPGVFTSDLAIQASRSCLAKAGVKPQEIDAIILATSSPDRIQPATACTVQSGIGATRAFAFDVNAVCTGGLYALHVAQAFIESGRYTKVLVVAAELYSRFLNPRDFATYPYFGDAAGAALVVASDGDPGIIKTLLRSDGAGADVIQIPAGGTRLPYAELKNPGDAYFRMHGREVYEFAVSKGPEVIAELVRQCQVSLRDVRLVIAHQANINILREIARVLEIEPERFAVSLDRYGNTAAASVFVTLDEEWSAGRIARGDLVVLVAFGGGLSWGASLVRL